MSTVDDARYMDLALALAQAQQGRTAPNPAVGCVLVRNGRILATGSTRDRGRPHAERVALDAAGDQAAGATAYVTLEPCAHHGQTPPCAEALVQAGVVRVVVACKDAFHKVAGRGLAVLSKAGIEVETDLRKLDAETIYAGFFQRLSTGLPQINVDRRARLYDAEVTAITAEAARTEVHALAAAGMNRVRISPDHPLANINWAELLQA